MKEKKKNNNSILIAGTDFMMHIFIDHLLLLINSILLYTSSFYQLCHNAFDQKANYLFNIYYYFYTILYYLCTYIYMYTKNKESDERWINKKIEDKGRQ